MNKHFIPISQFKDVFIIENSLFIIYQRTYLTLYYYPHIYTYNFDNFNIHLFIFLYHVQILG